MMNLNPNSTKILQNSGFMANRRYRRLVFSLPIIALFGFLDASYLAVEHFLNRVPPCTIVHGCQAVTTSQYSVIFGIPTAFLGALYYLVIILVLVYYFDTKRDLVLKAVASFTVLGFTFSLYLVYLMFFVIKAICLYCMISALSSTVLFILGMVVLKSLRSHSRKEVVVIG